MAGSNIIQTYFEGVNMVVADCSFVQAPGDHGSWWTYRPKLSTVRSQARMPQL